MNYDIHYLTTYRYGGLVTDNLNALRVRPTTSSTQRCDEFHVRLDPEARIHRHVDYFGTEVLEFGVARPHDHLTIDVRARVVTGGRQARKDSGGYYVEATVFDRVKPEMSIAREEIFGPVLGVLRFHDEGEAIALANGTSYGLQASVWSGNLSRAHRVSRALRAGTVHVNHYDEDDITVPFGGYKQSGNGRDKSLHALEKYTELKTTWIRID